MEASGRVAPSEAEGRAAPRAERSGRAGPILVGALVAAAVGVLVSVVRYGMGMTPDSVAYLEGAHSLSGGHGYTAITGGAILSWPPGYSAVLALVDVVTPDVDAAARVVSVVGLLATALLAHVLLRRHVRSPGIRAAGTVVVACSAVLLEVYSKMLSEHLFLPVVLLFVLVGEELMARPTDNRLLAAAVVLAWAAFYLRYAGVVLVGVGAVVLLVALRPRPAAALARTAVFVVAAAVLPALWLVRNVDAGGKPMGPRASAAASPLRNVYRIANELSQWLTTQLAGPPVRAAALLLAIVAAGALAWVVLHRPELRPRGLSRLVPLVAMVVVYLGYLAVAASLVAFGAINTRFLLPAYVPVVVLGAWLFEQVRDRLPSWHRVLTAVGVAWVALNVAWFAGRAVGYALHGAGGYATERWHTAEILQDAARLDFSVPTYSNDQRAISLFLGEAARRVPARTYFASDQETGDLPAFVRRVSCAGRAQLVWFLPHGATYLYDVDDLREVLDVEPVVERDDGVIYELRPRDDAEVDC